jgi:hypothetical protein
MPGRQDELAGKAGALLVRIGLGLLMVALPVAAIYSRRFVRLCRLEQRWS